MVFEHQSIEESYYKNPWLGHTIGEKANWLEQMGRAATKNGLSVTYSELGGGSDVMAALTIPAVISVMAAPRPPPPPPERHPQRQSPGGNHTGDSADRAWRLSGVANLAWAMGVTPMRASFCSATAAAASVHGATSMMMSHVQRPPPMLSAVSALLSNGPVRLGDGVGRLNASVVHPLIMVSSGGEDADAEEHWGRLLRPNAPCTALDQTLNTNWGDGELCAAPCGPVRVWPWFVVLAAATEVDTRITVSDLNLLPVGSGHSAGSASPMYVAVSSSFTSYHAPYLLNHSSAELWLASQQQGQSRRPSGIPWDLLLLAPVMAGTGQSRDGNGSGSGWLLIGEERKYLPLSAQRFPQPPQVQLQLTTTAPIQMQATSTKLLVPQVVLAANETVVVTVGYLWLEVVACEAAGAEVVMGEDKGHAAPVGCLVRATARCHRNGGSASDTMAIVCTEPLSPRSVSACDCKPAV